MQCLLPALVQSAHFPLPSFIFLFFFSLAKPSHANSPANHPPNSWHQRTSLLSSWQRERFKPAALRRWQSLGGLRAEPGTPRGPSPRSGDPALRRLSRLLAAPLTAALLCHTGEISVRQLIYSETAPVAAGAAAGPARQGGSSPLSRTRRLPVRTSAGGKSNSRTRRGIAPRPPRHRARDAPFTCGTVKQDWTPGRGRGEGPGPPARSPAPCGADADPAHRAARERACVAVRARVPVCARIPAAGGGVGGGCVCVHKCARGRTGARLPARAGAANPPGAAAAATKRPHPLPWPGRSPAAAAAPRTPHPATQPPTPPRRAGSARPALRAAHPRDPRRAAAQGGGSAPAPAPRPAPPLGRRRPGPAPARPAPGCPAVPRGRSGERHPRRRRPGSMGWS